MTRGQQRAIVELERLAQAAPDDLEFDVEEELKNGFLVVRTELRIGPLESAEGGLCFRERESFTLWIPSSTPFRYPHLEVTHRRFAGFPHVTWGRWLCLFQSVAQWNPEDGLYGYFDRLREWIGRAAMNDMDPIEGNLEPPYHLTASDELPFVIRENAPAPPGESWIGVAHLENHPNRIDLVGWSGLDNEWPKDARLAFATMLPGELPMEFPKLGRELFEEFAKQGLNRSRLLASLKFAALFSENGKPVHFVVGLPMRRSAGGDPRMHIAVWTIESAAGDLLRKLVLTESDSDEIRELNTETGEKLFDIIADYNVRWCKVMEDRDEIVRRRDEGTPLEQLRGKNILVLGCGALGSWVSEMVARSSPSGIDLVDSGFVKPGILIRQNFSPGDYGKPKAQALAERIGHIAPDVSVTPYQTDAHEFIVADLPRFSTYDLVLDCTAAPIFQMKLERDWLTFGGDSPRMISMFLDGRAQRVLAISIDRSCPGGIWDAYVRLKHRLCIEGQKELVRAFYSEAEGSSLFQPEPGCSDPTFVGSMADVVELSAAALNRCLNAPPDSEHSIGFSVVSTRCASPAHRSFLIKHDLRVEMTTARVYFSDAVLHKARSFVRQNARERCPSDETGGLLWGRWDEALGVIWVFDLSGPPPDSSHDNGRFRCGTERTQDEHERRFSQSGGTSGFIGFWHTHPEMASGQSEVDVGGMSKLVSTIGDNQRRALMLIFGQDDEGNTAGVYVYESHATNRMDFELVSVGEEQVRLEVDVL